MVLIVGYSLPAGDMDARRALSIGYHCNPDAKYFVIDPSEEVCFKYQRLFGNERLICIQEKIEEQNWETIESFFNGSQDIFSQISVTTSVCYPCAPKIFGPPVK
jgi:hypothetical protein